MSHPLKVLHLISRPQMRGAEMFAVRVASRLEQDGCVENAICSLYPSFGKDDYFNTGDLKTYELDVRQTLFDRVFRIDPKVVFRLRRVLKDFEPDVVIGHGADSLKYTSVAGWLRKDARTIYKNIGTASYWANTRARVSFNRFWLRNIDCSVSVSEHTRQDFVRHYGFDESRAVFIPNAIRVEDYDAVIGTTARQEIRREIGIAEDEIVMGMVGSLSPGKGQDELIKALSRLVKRGLPVRLVLVGTGPERERLAKVTEDYSVNDRVHFLGLRADVPQVLSAMDLFAMASISEGMPGVLIEAGLARLPSIAYNVGGVTEVLEHEVSGIVVEGNDFEGLVEGLERLVSSPDLRHRMGSEASERCRSKFNLNAVAGQYQALFQQLRDGAPLGNGGSSVLSAD